MQLALLLVLVLVLALVMQQTLLRSNSSISSSWTAHPRQSWRKLDGRCQK
jgi:uncharacterized MAPEG superfamily protein